jgi:hypothetical protein
MPAPRRRITQDEAPELPSNMRVSEQPPPQWRAENGAGGPSIRYWAGRLHQPTAIRLVELARPGRSTPEPLRLTLDCMVIDEPDAFNDQRIARTLVAVGTC